MGSALVLPAGEGRAQAQGGVASLVDGGRGFALGGLGEDFETDEEDFPVVAGADVGRVIADAAGADQERIGLGRLLADAEVIAGGEAEVFGGG